MDESEKRFNTYTEQSEYLKKIDKPFEDKLPVIYFNCHSGTYKLKLFKKFILINKKKNIIKAHMCIGDSHKKNDILSIDPSLNKIKYIVKKNMASFEYKYFKEHCNYKYLLNEPCFIMNDKIRLLLNLDCIIFSRISTYENFYTYTLKDNENHITFTNYKDLYSLFKKIENDPDLKDKIIQNNKEYCEKILTYDNILDYTALLLNNLF